MQPNKAASSLQFTTCESIVQTIELSDDTDENARVLIA